MKPYKHQVDIAKEAMEILREHAIVYLSMEERTGKTLTSILMAEDSTAKSILVITKKKALDGWVNTLDSFIHTKQYVVTNYHQVCNITGKFDLVILDEAHSYLSAYPKTGKIWKDVNVVTGKLPIIYLSATPSAQGTQLLFNQFRLSFWTPWRYINFYKWFEVYGMSNMTRTPYGLKETYTKCKPEAYESVKHLFITYTRAQLDFEHEPEDILHYVELDNSTKELYNGAMNDEVLVVNGRTIPLDSPMKLRTTLHMLEGGVAKDVDSYLILNNKEKIDAILRDFGDTKSTAIMYNYIAEGNKLREHFNLATILQGTSNAEGVDLSMFDNLIIYSQDFSTARHSQRRARQANKKRGTPIKVHFYLVNGAVSSQVYKTVSVNKTNFIDTYFNREGL